ncbi:tyrosine-protein kinase transmembrane receptor Ror2-like [Rhopalosiphum maidis]|uniref:tyrosine-protein kinase transmembrane receptor Ror2-like n=1 Tax=Rhopalosiphum maidis TaxID=43146 RepID=UPI000EFDB3C0|nr:tyrosine-protein kinase transmembrane receptor Ror2-like [Rhopalosiphum maidis]
MDFIKRASLLFVLSVLLVKQSTQVNSPDGYCAQYNGKICRKYLNASILIWFNNTLKNEGSEQNEIITTGLWEEMLPSFSKTCRPAAEKLLCLYAFPHCQQDKSYFPLCYEDCIAVRELFCYKEWALIEANKQRGIFYKSKGHFSLPFVRTYHITHRMLIAFVEMVVSIKDILMLLPIRFAMPTMGFKSSA